MYFARMNIRVGKQGYMCLFELILRRDVQWRLIPDINLYQQLNWDWEKLIFSKKIISLLGLLNSKFVFGLVSLDCRLSLLEY